MLSFAFPILWNNERKQVKIEALYHKGEKDAKDCEDLKHPKESQNLQLIYASGETRNESKLSDEDFGVTVENSVKIIRTVEMYQWVEHKKKHDNHYSYTYTKEWSSNVINSGSFHESGHSNPATKPFECKTTTAAKVEFGGYVLSATQVEKMKAKKHIALSNDEIEHIKEKTAGALKVNNYDSLKQAGSYFMAKSLSNNGSETEVGDVRILIEYVPCGPATVVA